MTRPKTLGECQSCCAGERDSRGRHVPGYEEQGQQLAAPVIAGPLALVGGFPRREAQVLARGLILPGGLGVERGLAGDLPHAGERAIGGISGSARWQERRVDGVEQESVEGLEHEIHSAWRRRRQQRGRACLFGARGVR